ncbi:MAG: histidine kinase [Bacteroidota bacterium]
MSYPPESSLSLRFWILLIGQVLWIFGIALYFNTYQERAALIEEHSLVISGDDRIKWQPTEGVLEAFHIHPLQEYRKFPPEKIQPGDRLRKIDYTEMYSEEMVDKVSASVAPGRMLLYQVERPNPANGIFQIENIRVLNGFRLSYAFQESPVLWRVHLWFSGVGTLVSVLILLILFPFIRSGGRRLMSLLFVVLLACLVFGLQFGRLGYLIVEGDQLVVERLYALLFPICLFAYVGTFAWLRIQQLYRWLLIPGVVAACVHTWINYTLLWGAGGYSQVTAHMEGFTLHLFCWYLAVSLLVFRTKLPKRSRQRLWLGGLAFVAAATSGIFFWLPASEAVLPKETWFLVLLGLLPVPLLNAAYSQLRFGKVSVVLTKSIQYLIFFALSLFLYGIIRQLFGLLSPENAYRNFLEVVVLMVSMALMRGLYKNREKQLEEYFITSQRKKREVFNAFLTRIPQFTSPTKLLDEFQVTLGDYFQPQALRISEMAELTGEWKEILYDMEERHTFWSKSKELSPFQFSGSLENFALNQPYSLVFPLNHEPGGGLVLMGRKRRGVYNLEDLELIARAAQQVSLSLNALYFIQRENELLKQTYQANLTALRSQINPHFLFNTLNTISALIHDSPDLAEEAVEKLAFIFRYTLKTSSENFVKLSSEMELVSTYLDIEKIRFGERLRIELEVEPEVRDVPIPALILQTLVENCIKHGIAKIIEKGLIHIDAYAEGDELVCEVFDNGPGVDLNRIDKGTGLVNTLTRLENIYGEKNLLYFENTGNGTLVRLRLPLSFETSQHS